MADSSESSSSQGAPESLAHQINVAIASSHTKINRLILERMPKAVPPQADNPSTYITGLLHIGAVYIAFESLWQDILGIHSEIAPIPYVFPFSNDPSQHEDTPQITERTRHVLEDAYWPNLVRAPRIKADIKAMTGWPDHVIDEQIRSAGTSGRLGKFTLHIRDSVSAKPHLLLAYAYCLYLALLSGGSYIRTELLYLKSDFWHRTPTPVRPNMVQCKPDRSFEKPRRHSAVECDSVSHGLARDDQSLKIPLEFLDFDPPLGENARQQSKDLKAEFKRRFAQAEQLLAEPERTDIVKESAAIFQNLEGVVGQLDRMCGTSQGQDHMPTSPHSPLRSSGGMGMGFRLRDSIAIAKGRLLRTRRKASGGSVTATVPMTPEELSDSHGSGSSRPSSISEAPAEYQEASLARDAVIPGEGFRTVHYDDDLPRPDREPQGDRNNGKGNTHGLDGALFDRANSYVGIDPTSRIPTRTETIVQKEGPNYALYAMISNFVVLAGIAILFAAYLHIRHGGFMVDL